MPSFLNRLKRRPSETTQSHPPVDWSDLLAQRILEHFPGGSRDGLTVKTGVADVEIDCRVESVNDGAETNASLYFLVRGGPFGPVPAFASISGYGPNGTVAIVEGACLWACTFRSVLRSAFLGAQPDDTEDVHIVELRGRRFTLHVDRIDRAWRLAGEQEAVEPEGGFRIARESQFGFSWLLDRAIASGTLPAISGNHAVLLSAFATRAGDQHLTELKIRGSDWAPGLESIRLPEEVPGYRVSLRELGILVPVERERYTPDRLQATLEDIGRVQTETYRAAGWRGWRTHEGRLARCLTETEVIDAERLTGPLPPEYRQFLLDVGGPGSAGPGYGLLAPRRVGGVLPLAWAGCGVAWVLQLEGSTRGQVWLDARGSDDTYMPVADSFTEWYTNWLDAAIGYGPWVEWDHRACAAMNGLASYLMQMPEEQRRAHRIEAGKVTSIALTGGGAYAPEGSPLDPCHECVVTYESWGLDESVFGRGICSERGAG